MPEVPDDEVFAAMVENLQKLNDTTTEVSQNLSLQAIRENNEDQIITEKNDSVNPNLDSNEKSRYQKIGNEIFTGGINPLKIIMRQQAEKEKLAGKGGGGDSNGGLKAIFGNMPKIFAQILQFLNPKHLIKALIDNLPEIVDSIMSVIVSNFLKKMVLLAIAAFAVFQIFKDPKTWAKLWEMIKDTLVSIWNWITDPELWSALWDACVAAWDWIVEIASDCWDWIVDAAVGAWDWIKDVIAAGWKWISDLVSGIWKKISDFAIGVWNGIKNTAIAIWDNIKNFVVGMWEGIKNTVVGLWDSVKEKAMGLWDTVTGIFDKVVDFAKEAFSGFVRGIKNMFIRMINGIIDGINIIPGVDIDHLKEDKGPEKKEEKKKEEKKYQVQNYVSNVSYTEGMSTADLDKRMDALKHNETYFKERAGAIDPKQQELMSKFIAEHNLQTKNPYDVAQALKEELRNNKNSNYKELEGLVNAENGTDESNRLYAMAYSEAIKNTQNIKDNIGENNSSAIKPEDVQNMVEAKPTTPPNVNVQVEADAQQHKLTQEQTDAINNQTDAINKQTAVIANLQQGGNTTIINNSNGETTSVTEQTVPLDGPQSTDAALLHGSQQS